MRLRTDDRGVTVQIGTVLLFAVLVVLLSTYQATVVPQQNERVEFNHNQRVQGQLQDLRDGLLRTAATGSSGSTAVDLGTQYPVRAFFVNPAPPSGTLRTTSAAPLRVENAKAAGETGDYWTGDDRSFDTRGVVYEPIYHVYQNPPTTAYRNDVLYNRFDSADRVVAGQQLVRDNTISLVALSGTLSESSSTTASVTHRPVSPATRTVTVRNEPGESLALVVPTSLSVEKWEQLLKDELDPDGDDPDGHVEAVESAGDDAVRIVLESGVYQLRLANVGIGRDLPAVGPHYVTDVEGDNSSVAEGTTRKLVVEVRDRYNNPVTGARVYLSLDSDEPDDALVYRGESSDEFSDLMTDSQGRVEVRYDAAEFNGDTRKEAVDVSIEDAPNAEFDPGAKENLTFEVTVYNTGPGGGNGGSGGSGGGAGGGKSSLKPSKAVMFRANDDELRSIDRSGTIEGFSATGPVRIAPLKFDFDDDDRMEAPFTDGDQNLRLADEAGDTQTLVDGDTFGPGLTQTRIAVGDWENEGPEVFFVDGDGYVRRVAPGESADRIVLKDTGGSTQYLQASAVAGVGDFNGDGDADLVIVDPNQKLAYVDDAPGSGNKKRTVEQLDDPVTLNTASAVSPPADVDADGGIEVGYNEGDNPYLRIADAVGEESQLTSGSEGSLELPLGTYDWTGDGQPELIYVEESTNYLRYVTADGETGYLRDENDGRVTVTPSSGAS